MTLMRPGTEDVLIVLCPRCSDHLGIEHGDRDGFDISEIPVEEGTQLAGRDLNMKEYICCLCWANRADQPYADLDLSTYLFDEATCLRLTSESGTVFEPRTCEYCGKIGYLATGKRHRPEVAEEDVAARIALIEEISS